MKLYSALMIESFGDLEVTPLEPSEVESIVLPAKSNFGRQSCVQDICGREHGEVCSFLDAVRVYKFEVKRKPMYNMHLSGLSSYDGTAAYINVRRLPYPETAACTLERELAHCALRWMRRI
mmetsp:Transcript_71894/g.191923  ORF Transcript_71894/g.191923 Transcript_71894/m.191923 type:complete len:121 (-) Transcript_71894:598-960(-)